MTRGAPSVLHLRKVYGAPVKRCLFSLFALLFTHAPSHAQDFYQGKTLSILVGYGPGGGYDVYARLMQKFIGRRIPGNPAVVTRNMPGAGSLTMMNHLFNDAPRDGLTIGASSRIAPLEPLFGNAAARFRAPGFVWIGTPASYEDDAYSLIVRAESNFASLADAQKPGTPILFGGFANGGSDTDIVLIARSIFKLNARFIRGYAGGPEVGLAMARGEIDGRAIGMSSLLTLHPDLVRGNALRYLVQFGHKTRWKGLPDTPTAGELADNDADRAVIDLAELPFRMARPLAAPPGTPAAQAAILRKAFVDMLADPEYRAEARRLQLEISPLPGEAVQAELARAAAIPRAVIERYTAILAEP